MKRLFAFIISGVFIISEVAPVSMPASPIFFGAGEITLAPQSNFVSQSVLPSALPFPITPAAVGSFVEDRKTFLSIEDLRDAHRYQIESGLQRRGSASYGFYDAQDASGKRVRLFRFTGQEGDVRRLVSVLGHCNHPGIPKIGKVFRLAGKSDTYVEVERLGGEPLGSAKIPMGFIQLVKVCRDAGRILQHLHENHILYGPLTKDSIYVDSQYRVNLQHFHQARIYGQDVTPGEGMKEMIKEVANLALMFYESLNDAQDTLLDSKTATPFDFEKRRVFDFCRQRKYLTAQQFVEDLDRMLQMLKYESDNQGACYMPAAYALDRGFTEGDTWKVRNGQGEHTWTIRGSVPGKDVHFARRKEDGSEVVLKYSLLGFIPSQQGAAVDQPDEGEEMVVLELASGKDDNDSAVSPDGEEVVELELDEEAQPAGAGDGVESSRLSFGAMSVQEASSVAGSLMQPSGQVENYLKDEWEKYVLSLLGHVGTSPLRRAYMCAHPSYRRYADGNINGTAVGSLKEIALVQGKSLQEYLAQEVTSLEQLLLLIKRTTHVLHRVHAEGIIHRDINPRNIIVTNDQAAELIDFNIAVRKGYAAAKRSIAGTPYYISPDQILSQPSDYATDTYGLAATLFALFLAFDSVGVLETLYHFKLSMVEKFNRRVGTGYHGDIPLRVKRWVSALVGELRYDLLKQYLKKKERNISKTAREKIMSFFKRALKKDMKSRYTTAWDFLMAVDEVLATLGYLPEKFDNQSETWQEKDIADGMTVYLSQEGKDSGTRIQCESPEKQHAYLELLMYCSVQGAKIPSLQMVNDIHKRGDDLYIDTELIEDGIPLSAYIREAGYSPEERQEVLRQVSQGLADILKTGLELKSDIHECLDDIWVKDGTVKFSFRILKHPMMVCDEEVSRWSMPGWLRWCLYQVGLVDKLDKGQRSYKDWWTKGSFGMPQEVKASFMGLACKLLIPHLEVDKVGWWDVLDARSRGTLVQTFDQLQMPSDLQSLFLGWVGSCYHTHFDCEALADMLRCRALTRNSYHTPLAGPHFGKSFAFKQERNPQQYEIVGGIVPQKLVRVREGDQQYLMLHVDFRNEGLVDAVKQARGQPEVLKQKLADLRQTTDHARKRFLQASFQRNTLWPSVAQVCEKIYYGDNDAYLKIRETSTISLKTYMLDKSVSLEQRVRVLYSLLAAIKHGYRNFQRPDARLIRVNKETRQVYWFALDMAKSDTALSCDECLWDAPAAICEMLLTAIKAERRAVRKCCEDLVGFEPVHDCTFAKLFSFVESVQGRLAEFAGSEISLPVLPVPEKVGSPGDADVEVAAAPRSLVEAVQPMSTHDTMFLYLKEALTKKRSVGKIFGGFLSRLSGAEDKKKMVFPEKSGRFSRLKGLFGGRGGKKGLAASA